MSRIALAATVTVAVVVTAAIVLHSTLRPPHPRTKNLFSSLPPEILLRIAEYFKAKDLRRVAATCRSLSIVVGSPVLWQKLTVRRFGKEWAAKLDEGLEVNLKPARRYVTIERRERRTRLCLAAELRVGFGVLAGDQYMKAEVFERISGSVSPKPVIIPALMRMFSATAFLDGVKPGTYIPYFRFQLGRPSRSLQSWKFKCTIVNGVRRSVRDGSAAATVVKVEKSGRDLPMGLGGVLVGQWMVITLDPITIEDEEDGITASPVVLEMFDLLQITSGTVAIDVMGLEEV
ncbi:hypothetical protein HK101_000965 [Irineochytrium annulatum]|nr:hypothetical protein HK101_000965 [Irineochytrium annulatum]